MVDVIVRAREVFLCCSLVWSVKSPRHGCRKAQNRLGDAEGSSYAEGLVRSNTARYVQLGVGRGGNFRPGLLTDTSGCNVPSLSLTASSH